ncbi:MAG: NADH-quinone oxidoreductase subunit G, partial [Jatrophihabitantaceae bacterium]
PAATSRVSAPAEPAARSGQRPEAPNQLVLASWPELIDAGSMLDGEPNLAGTAKPLRAVIGKQTALELGLAEGELIRIEAAGRLLRVPLQLKDGAAPGMVWLPANHRDGSVRVVLNLQPGALVMVTRDGDTAGTTGGAA